MRNTVNPPFRKAIMPALTLVAFACMTHGFAVAEEAIVGAIRWDGWYGDGTVTKAVEASLGQPKYHFRLPWFAQLQSDGSVRINGDSQAIMEQELAYAAAARLNYWAVVDYWDEAPGMSKTRRTWPRSDSTACPPTLAAAATT